MGGSKENLGAPDSWETTDLEESMRRMLLSAKNGPSLQDFSEEGSSESVAPSSSSPVPPPSAFSCDRRGGILEDALNQVDPFLREVLEKPRERLLILRMEQDVEKFIRDPTQQQLEFEALPTSYLRLAAHRIAQHYNLQSLAVPDNSLPDGSGSRIILHKTSECCFPLVRLADIPVNLPREDNNNVVKVAIKQRPQKRSQDISNINTHPCKVGHPRSVEERKEEYNRARARIFSSSGGGGTMAKSDGDSVGDSAQCCLLVPARPSEVSIFEGPENNHERGLSGSSTGSNRLNKITTEEDPVTSRYRASNRVAIFHDREIDRKDPDYDRSYER